MSYLRGYMALPDIVTNGASIHGLKYLHQVMLVPSSDVATATLSWVEPSGSRQIKLQAAANGAPATWTSPSELGLSIPAATITIALTGTSPVLQLFGKDWSAINQNNANLITRITIRCEGSSNLVSRSVVLRESTTNIVSRVTGLRESTSDVVSRVISLCQSTANIVSRLTSLVNSSSPIVSRATVLQESTANLICTITKVSP